MKSREIKFILFLFTLLGLLCVFSSSAVFSFEQYGSKYMMVFKQFLFFAAGWVVFYLMQKFTGKKAIAALAVFITVVSMLGLINVLISGVRINNAKRWIQFFGFTVQPSEFFKISALLLLAFSINKQGKIILKNKRGVWEWGNVFRISIILAGLALVLVAPDMGTTVTIGAALLAGLVFSKTNFKYTAGILLICTLLAIAFIYFSPYRRARVVSMFKSGGGQTFNYQRFQSQNAIQKGGVFGKGIGRGRMKVFSLPEAWSDFIFSVISEEVGLIGGILLIGLYFLLFLRIYNIGNKTKDIQLKYFTLMFLVLLSMQVGFNIGVAVGVLPPTGMVLPLISSGGSALIAFMMGFGICEAVRNRNG